jgi:hypothetical protein
LLNTRRATKLQRIHAQAISNPNWDCHPHHVMRATGGGSFPNPRHWKTQANWRGGKMLTQIRIYTINKGEMDNFLKHFKEEIMPLHEKIGVPIVGTWVNRPQNEFIWVRTYKDKAELEAKTKELQVAVAAAGVKLGGNVAKMEVREVESAFA